MPQRECQQIKTIQQFSFYSVRQKKDKGKDTNLSNGWQGLFQMKSRLTVKCSHDLSR